MRLALAGRAPDTATCARWSGVAPSSTPAGPPDAIVDHYRAHLPAKPGSSSVAVFEHLRQRLLEYDIFPPPFMLHGRCPAGPIEARTTIVQRVQADGLFALEMAVRVTRAWDGDSPARREAGFTYVTLQGHAERGVESFRVQLDHASGCVSLLIDARSAPGLWLSRVGFPLARVIQLRLTRAAVRRLIENSSLA